MRLLAALAVAAALLGSASPALAWGDLGHKVTALIAYPVQQVGAREHLEYWILAEHLAEFNAAIVGPIEVIAEFR